MKGIRNVKNMLFFDSGATFSSSIKMLTSVGSCGDKLLVKSSFLYQKLRVVQFYQVFVRKLLRI